MIELWIPGIILASLLYIVLIWARLLQRHKRKLWRIRFKEKDIMNGIIFDNNYFIEKELFKYDSFDSWNDTLYLEFQKVWNSKHYALKLVSGIIQFIAIIVSISSLFFTNWKISLYIVALPALIGLVTLYFKMSILFTIKTKYTTINNKGFLIFDIIMTSLFTRVLLILIMFIFNMQSLLCEKEASALKQGPSKLFYMDKNIKYKAYSWNLPLDRWLSDFTWVNKTRFNNGRLPDQEYEESGLYFSTSLNTSSPSTKLPKIPIVIQFLILLFAWLISIPNFVFNFLLMFLCLIVVIFSGKTINAFGILRLINHTSFNDESISGDSNHFIYLFKNNFTHWKVFTI